MPPKTAIVVREPIECPHVFTFSLPNNTAVPEIDDFALELEENRDFLNHLFSGKSISMVQRNALVGLHSQLIDANEAIDELIYKGLLDDVNRILILEFNAFLKLAAYATLNYVPDASNEERQAYLLAVVAPLQDSTHRNSTASWYYAIACIRLYDQLIDETFLSIAAGTLRSITSNQHKEGIYSLIMNKLTQMRSAPAYYPESTVFLILNGSLPNHTWAQHEPTCALIRHSYVMKHELRNHSYFDPQYSADPSQLTHDRDLFLKITKENSVIAQERVVKESVSDGDLLKFAAQLGGVAPPSPLFQVDGATPAQEAAFNDDLIVILYEQKLVTSQGFLLKKVYADDLSYKPFQQIVIDCYKKHIGQPPSQGFLDALLHQMDRASIEDQCQSIGLIRKRLAGMASQKALLLYQHALDIQKAHGLAAAVRGDVQQTVRQCLEIFGLAKDIHDSNQSHPQKHENWFKLSQKIVADCINKKSNIIINVGKPVIVNEENTGHAIYVAIKWQGDAVQVIITNGGFGALKFHQKAAGQAEDVAENDRCILRYAAFKPFELTDENKMALTHYLYKLITLRYTAAANMEEVGAYGFWELYGNIYLKEQDGRYYFDGYQGKILKQFVREDLEETYLAQFHGNCTVHNLSRSVKVLFDMDELMFGLLEDNLLIGTDTYISACGAAPASNGLSLQLTAS